MKGYGNYDKYPELKIDGFETWQGYANIADELRRRAKGKKRFVIVFDCYPEVDRRKCGRDCLRSVPNGFSRTTR